VGIGIGDGGLPQKMANADFETAFRKGFWRAVIGWLGLRDTHLQPFDEVIRRYELRGQHTVGMKTVLLEDVVGSVGRYNDFDSIFLPRQTRTRERWIKIDEAHLKEIALPAVELYKVGDGYYVKDGNHRVSVARERGQKFIDAYVTEIDFAEPLNKDVDLIERIRQLERADFNEKTGIRSEFGADIELSLAGGYDKLLDHIQVHRWFMGEQRHEVVTWEEAVVSWYKEVYMPLIHVIQENKALNDFPGRSAADLYLWIIEHLWYLREAYQQEISMEDATEHFTEEYSSRPLRWIVKFFRRITRLVTGDG
jgi:hypothetical protein